jgi:hypothetical protein
MCVREKDDFLKLKKKKTKQKTFKLHRKLNIHYQNHLLFQLPIKGKKNNKKKLNIFDSVKIQKKKKKKKKKTPNSAHPSRHAPINPL